MITHLPDDLESSIQAEVHSGRFASVDDAMAEAARLLLREIEKGQLKPTPATTDTSPDPLLGVWHDAADELDEIVVDAYRHRREDRWREFDL